MLVSIIMPTYNCAGLIAESIESVLAQTHREWELLIVDDCSTDNTKQVVQPYLDRYPEISYECLTENGGPAAARNAALRRAKGRYIAFLDSDDLWVPEKLEKQIAFMQQSGEVFTCTAYDQMDEQGRSLHVRCIPPLQTDYRTCLRLSNPIGNLTVMYDQQALGRYQVPPIRKRNDFALWLRILHDTPCCAGMQESLAFYRIRENSVSTHKLQQARYHWQLYYQIEHLGLLKSAWAMLCWAWVKGTGLGLHREKC